MALSKNVFTSRVEIALDLNSAFAAATRFQTTQIIDSVDGSVAAERSKSDPLTLAQLKTLVAAL